MDTNDVVFTNGADQPQTAANLAPLIQALIQRYQGILKASEAKGEINAIHVDEIASKFAVVYERIRKIIDWKDEHLIRRAAIERILKRRLIAELSGFSLIKDLKPEEIAEPIVLELIRGTHFPNDQIPREKINEVAKILHKYIYILENNPLRQNSASLKIKAKVNFYMWLLEIAACEIEETLDPALKEYALIDFMTQAMMERIKIDPRLNVSEQDKYLQIYIAVHRALFNLDDPLISYRLIKLHFPEWLSPSAEELRKISEDILGMGEIIGKDLSYSLAPEIRRICEKYDTVYLIIGDILKNLPDPSQTNHIFSDENRLRELVEVSYQKRYATLRSRLNRTAFYSTLSIFVAGAASLFIVEFPLAKLVYGRFSPLAIVIDLGIPTSVMCILMLLIKMPGPGNLERLNQEIGKIVYQSDQKDIYEIRPPRKRGLIGKVFIGLFYFVITVVSLWLTFLVFYVVKTPATSLPLDTVNVAMVVFAGLIIRQRSKELTIEEKPTFWEFLLDMLSLPIGKIGQWFANKWKEYNIVSVFFTALVDTPFSSLVEFIENWSMFIKEKKAELH